VVGKAYKFLLDERMEHGPLDPAVAEARLREWWAGQPEAAEQQPAAGVELSTTEES